MRFPGDSQRLFELFFNTSFQALSQIFEKRLATIILVMSVCLSAAIRPYFMKVDILIFYRKTVGKIRVSLKSDKKNGISSLRLVLYDVCFLLGNSPASGVYMPTFRNTLSVPSS